MRRVDLTLPVGLLIGTAAVGAAAVYEGVRPGFLWQPAALLVVLGGTAGAVVVRRSLGGLVRATRALRSLFLREDFEGHAAEAARLMWLARAARRDGVRVYETHAAQSRDRLVSTGLALAADHAKGPAVRAVLERILRDEDEEGLQDAATLEAAGGFAPTFGVLGAVLGLIGVLRSLADPAALGGGIATAFVATLYGVGVANLFFFPVASRLRERHEALMRRREALADALVALADGELPSAVAQRFNAHAANL